MMLKRCLVVIILSTNFFFITSCSNKKQEEIPEKEQKLGVISLKKETYPIKVILVGRADSYKTAEIRPQISGKIKKILFKEGSNVKKDDILYLIEDDLYYTTLLQAKANLEKATASIPNAKANLERYKLLSGTAATQMAYEQHQMELSQAYANVEAEKAAVQIAQFNLDHTKITAPFDGVTTFSNYSVGNIVTANQGSALTTIRQINPIYVKLSQSSVEELLLRDKNNKNPSNIKKSNIAIKLFLEGDVPYQFPGELDMSDIVIQETTSTSYIRASFPNPEHIVLPGMYVRAEVQVSTEEGFKIPQLAASHDLQGNLTAFFISNNTGKVEEKHFKNSIALDNFWIVNENIQNGDRLIVDGLQTIATGQKVKPIEVFINAQGLITDKKTTSSTN